MVAEGVQKAYEKHLDGKVWKELKDELPDFIFDAHVHCSRAKDKFRPGPVNPSLPFATAVFGFAKCDKVSKLLWRGKRFRCLAFNSPAPDSGTDAANRWVARGAKKRGWPTLALVRPEWSAETVEAMLSRDGHVGVKPYWNYVTHKAQNDVTIEDMVKPDVLELLQSRGAPLLLHIPRAGRLACPVNLASLHRICREFPKLPLVLAHVGRSYGMDQAPPISEFKKLARHENLWAEFAMVQSIDVAKVCLETFGWERCIFGTDLPIAELKGKVVTVNGQNLFVTRKPYPWSVSPVSAVDLRCTFFAYEIVRAIVTAMKQLGLKSRARDAIFRKNAERVYVRSRTH